MSRLSCIPQEPHYAIIRATSIHHEGDERSRTAPGHGYPAWTETVMAYHPYRGREEWIAEIERLVARKEAFQAIEVKPAEVSTSVSVTVG